MKVVLWPLQWVALAGFAVSLLVHLMAVFQVPVPTALQAYINDDLYGLLGAGIFVVWVPTVLAASRVARADGVSGTSIDTALQGCPPWMRKAVPGLFIYVLVNFFWTIGLEQQAATEGSAFVQRGFSGHWLLFYGVAFAVMYSVLHKPALLQARSCAAGHSVRYGDQYCPTCGQPLTHHDADA